MAPDDSMASFDFGEKSVKHFSKSAKKHGISFFSKAKTDDKKTKIKSYQQLLKNENKKIQGAYEKKKI